MLDSACNTVWFFTWTIITQPHTNCSWQPRLFPWRSRILRSVHSEVRQLLSQATFSPYTSIDARPINYHAYLFFFISYRCALALLYQYYLKDFFQFRQSSDDFTELITIGALSPFAIRRSQRKSFRALPLLLIY